MTAAFWFSVIMGALSIPLEKSHEELLDTHNELHECNDKLIAALRRR
jgi:hypothetical protein